MKFKINGAIVIQLLLITVFLSIYLLGISAISFSKENQNSYIIYKGDKYYRCSTHSVKHTDTLITPAGITIVETFTISNHYDHFNCK